MQPNKILCNVPPITESLAMRFCDECPSPDQLSQIDFISPDVSDYLLPLHRRWQHLIFVWLVFGAEALHLLLLAALAS